MPRDLSTAMCGTQIKIDGQIGVETLPLRKPLTASASEDAPFTLFLSVFCAWLTVFSCVALAGENTPAPGPVSGSPTPSKSQEGLTNIPIAKGYDAKGLVLPQFDLKGRLRGKLEAGITTRLDDDRVQFKGVKYTTFTEAEALDLEITMSSSIFNLKTQMLNSSERTTVKRADFEIAGDTMQFEMNSRKGVLEGNVKMVVRGKARAPQQTDE